MFPGYDFAESQNWANEETEHASYCQNIGVVFHAVEEIHTGGHPNCGNKTSNHQKQV